MASDSSTCACDQVPPRADLLSRNPNPNINPNNTLHIGLVARLRLGGDVRQVLAAREALAEGRLRADVGGQPDGLAHVGDAGHEQEAARPQRRQVFQRDAAREQQRRGEAEALQHASAASAKQQCTDFKYTSAVGTRHYQAAQRLDAMCMLHVFCMQQAAATWQTSSTDSVPQRVEVYTI